MLEDCVHFEMSKLGEIGIKSSAFILCTSEVLVDVLYPVFWLIGTEGIEGWPLGATKRPGMTRYLSEVEQDLN